MIRDKETIRDRMSKRYREICREFSVFSHTCRFYESIIDMLCNAPYMSC